MKTMISKKQVKKISSDRTIGTTMPKANAVHVNLIKVPKQVYDANKVKAYKPLVP